MSASPSRPSSPRGPYRGKRAFDLTVVAIIAVPVAIVGSVCALAVRLTSRGPVIFRQQRVGMHGEPLTLLKFRTMFDDPHRTSAYPTADSITRVGRVLRRFSLDELPQLVNVARGEMSVVGPRPTLAYQVERYDDEQRGRLAVKPGLTGLAQVRGRNELPWPERIVLDLEYVREQSVLLDTRLILATLRTLLEGSGVEGHPTDDPLAQTQP